jgi:putative nucleotidyltransferase with HDIG domain
VSAVKYDKPSHTLTMRISQRHVYRAYLASQWILLAGVIAVAVLTSRWEDWQPLEMVVLLVILGVLGERLTVTIGSQTLSSSFVAFALAMALLGPAPAVAIAFVMAAVDYFSRKPSMAVTVSNTAAYMAFSLLGALAVRAIVGNVHDPHIQQSTRGVEYALIVFGVFVSTNIVNFALIALQKRVLDGRGLMMQVRTLLIPMLPVEFAASILAAVLAVAYTNLGYPALVGVVMVILIFQYLARALLRSEDRAEQLEARSVRLASMQLGMLATLVETLALRDRRTARHAAAVARYARALARDMGCSDAEQELVHTAGLLHDIGKFALPDRILHAEILSDEDWALVRRHPQDGATLVGRLDGYGPVADAILYHHEHVDGSGYPAGLIGSEIPYPSRIVAVCSVYDTLTARDSYRSPMIPQDAIAELRRVAGRQLDAEIVDAFVTMLERDGPVTFAHGDDANFEAELSFERRTRALAQPAS